MEAKSNANEFDGDYIVQVRFITSILLSREPTSTRINQKIVGTKCLALAKLIKIADGRSPAADARRNECAPFSIACNLRICGDKGDSFFESTHLKWKWLHFRRGRCPLVSFCNNLQRLETTGTDVYSSVCCLPAAFAGTNTHTNLFVLSLITFQSCQRSQNLII